MDSARPRSGITEFPHFHAVAPSARRWLPVTCVRLGVRCQRWFAAPRCATRISTMGSRLDVESLGRSPQAMRVATKPSAAMTMNAVILQVVCDQDQVAGDDGSSELGTAYGCASRMLAPARWDHPAASKPHRGRTRGKSLSGTPFALATGEMQVHDSDRDHEDPKGSTIQRGRDRTGSLFSRARSGRYGPA